MNKTHGDNVSISVGANLRIAFWGTSRFSVFVLNGLAQTGLLPALIITAPAKPKGRGLVLTPSDVKVWADAHNIPTLEPAEIKSDKFLETLARHNFDEQNLGGRGTDWDLFIIASYGKIISRTILDLPKHGTLNVHPSLLPKLRGATPLQSAILEDVPVGEPHQTGVTIMLIDEEVDHGPIVAQEKLVVQHWPPKESDLEETLGVLGGKILAETIPSWISGDITPVAQNHDLATYTKKISKADAHISLDDNSAQIYRKIHAFNIWPRTYFTAMRSNREVRVVITEARFENNALVIDRVIPEGKREMTYEEFLRGQK